jgi:IS30 family transposase
LIPACKLASKHADPAPRTMTAPSMTLDNGKEFACFKYVEKNTGIGVSFANAYAAWQRGANENVNGLIR